MFQLVKVIHPQTTVTKSAKDEVPRKTGEQCHEKLKPVSKEAMSYEGRRYTFNTHCALLTFYFSLFIFHFSLFTIDHSLPIPFIINS